MAANTKKQRRPRLAFLSPRLAEDGAVGGAETLLFNLASLASKAGFDVEFLTTCARNHFTWANELEPGETFRDGIKVVRFPVNETRDGALFLSLQSRISQGETFSDGLEGTWFENNVRSGAMMDYIRNNAFSRIVAGPYLFGLAVEAARLFPNRTLLVPCLHDEPFARLRCISAMFRSVSGFCFNTGCEMKLAESLYGLHLRAPGDASASPAGQPAAVVGFAIDPFGFSPSRGRELAGTNEPFLLFCGRREPLKGTPMLLDYWAAFRRTHPGSQLKFVFTGSGEIDTPEDLRADVIDLGFVSEQDKHDLMAAALAFCHASVNESLGIVLLESWLAGRPALVFSKGQVLTSQTMASGGGLWFANCAEFIGEVEWLIDNPAAAAALGSAGHRWTVANYSSAAVSSRLTALLESA